MGSKWTVQTSESEKVDLEWTGAPDGTGKFWIRIKPILSTGEDRYVKTAGWRGVSGVGKEKGEQEIRVDWKETGIARAHTWLVDWSLTDDKDKKLPLTMPSIAALHPDVFELIENAITAQVEAIEAKKKARTGSSAPSLTSD